VPVFEPIHLGMEHMIIFMSESSYYIFNLFNQKHWCCIL